MQIPSNFKNYVLIGLLIFYLLIIISFYYSKMQEGFKEGATSSDKTNESTITISTSQYNKISSNIATLRSEINELLSQFNSIMKDKKETTDSK